MDDHPIPPVTSSAFIPRLRWPLREETKNHSSNHTRFTQIKPEPLQHKGGQGDVFFFSRWSVSPFESSYRVNTNHFIFYSAVPRLTPRSVHQKTWRGVQRHESVFGFLALNQLQNRHHDTLRSSSVAEGMKTCFGNTA